VLACPFGVPKMKTEFKLMMKCDMCYDRTSAGKKPMCATVCPSGALFFGTREQVEQLRPRSQPVNEFRFGDQTITTKVNVMTPRAARTEYVDVTASLDEGVIGKEVTFNILEAISS
jgi:Fe-S-cluster-containing dehydrogenase component